MTITEPRDRLRGPGLRRAIHKPMQLRRMTSTLGITSSWEAASRDGFLAGQALLDDDQDDDRDGRDQERRHPARAVSWTWTAS